MVEHDSNLKDEAPPPDRFRVPRLARQKNPRFRDWRQSSHGTMDGNDVFEGLLMNVQRRPGLLCLLDQLFRTGTAAGLSDEQLLERFATRHDEAAEAAFAALMERHGPMVLSVCRRTLTDPHDALDAFQATFLVLIRKAGSVRKRGSLASWLFGVAMRVSARTRGAATRRREVECGAERRDVVASERPNRSPIGVGVRLKMAFELHASLFLSDDFPPAAITRETSKCATHSTRAAWKPVWLASQRVDASRAVIQRSPWQG